MKFAFLVIAIFINCFNHSLIKSEEKIFSSNNAIENIARKESITEEKTEIKKIHIVKSGDTISSISKFYSINKDLIINSIHYLVNNSDRLILRDKNLKVNSLDKIKIKKYASLWKWFMLIIPLLIGLLSGFVIQFLRLRNRS